MVQMIYEQRCENGDDIMIGVLRRSGLKVENEWGLAIIVIEQNNE